MKKLILLLALVATTFSSAMAQSSLSDLLNNLGNKNQEQTATEQTPSTDKKTSGLGDMLSGVAGALGLGNSKASVQQLAGTWNYVKPAVAFKSDNFLLKAGGAAAATTVEKKIEPYYQKIGLTSLQLVINTDSTFTFTAKKAKLSGTIKCDAASGNYEFSFKAFNKIPVGSMTAYIQLTGSKMELTFDVSKLMKIMESVGSISGSSALKGASGLLNKYDGMTAGFELNRTSKATATTSK